MGVWQVCNKYVVTNNQFTVTGIPPGSKPLFRVVAINEYGESRYSNIAGPVTCKDDVIFPSVEVLGFKEIEIGAKLEIFAKVRKLRMTKYYERLDCRKPNA